MKLMTKEIEKRLEKFPLYSQADKGDDARILVKFFNPYGIGTWYVLEAEKLDDGDYRFFGLVQLNELEYGYFLFSELNKLRVPPFGFPIERDLYLDENAKVKDIN